MSFQETARSIVQSCTSIGSFAGAVQITIAGKITAALEAAFNAGKESQCIAEYPKTQENVQSINHYGPSKINPDNNQNSNILDEPPRFGHISDEEIEGAAVEWAVATSKTNTQCPACAEDILWTHVASDFREGARWMQSQLKPSPISDKVVEAFIKEFGKDTTEMHWTNKNDFNCGAWSALRWLREALALVKGDGTK
jgi:hypothetical protein